jgi:dihydrofolate reductase
MRLNSVIKEHTLKDELCGNHVVISTDKLNELVVNLKQNITDACEKEIRRQGGKNRYAKTEKPLVDAILLMNKKEEDGKGDTDESQTDDNHREVDMGETDKYSPFGGIVVDKD